MNQKSLFIVLLALFTFASPAKPAGAEPQDANPPQTSKSMDKSKQLRRPIVIVHGAWGGAHHWQKVAEGLQQHGEEVHRVCLTGLGARSHLNSPEVTLTTHIKDVVNTIEFEDLQSVVLIAHSYGGVVASGAADLIPDRISQRIYIDSHVLDSGESYLTHHPEKRKKYTQRANEDGDGWQIPVDWPNNFRDAPHPLATLTQPLELKNANRKKIPATYWLLADGKPAKQDERYRYLQRSQQRGWDTQVLSWNHNPQRERPNEVAQELLKLLQ